MYYSNEFVLQVHGRPEPKVYLGLDLGQRRDHSALASVHLTFTDAGRCPLSFANRFRPGLMVKTIERFPLGTCYDDLHDIVLERIRAIDKASAQPFRDATAKTLIIDAGGPGPPVVDRLRNSAPRSLRIKPVIITGGKGANNLTGGYTGIPRRTLISDVLIALNSGTLRCDGNDPGWPIFRSELLTLRGDTTQPNDHDAHDDVVLAVALAVNAAIRDTPELVPNSPEARRDRVVYGFVNKPLPWQRG